ncbi:MAG: hypothetical protein M0R75_12910 [Dehalococcoidia bacterium]|nr:hypothetical protein [Dehalococcoidia bacterium]
MVSHDERDDVDDEPEDPPEDLVQDMGQDPGDDAHEDGTPSDGPVTPRQLLRHALVDDEDPRFPRWLPIPGVLLGLGWAGYQAIAGDAGFLPTLGISGAIFAGTTLATWLGWQLEID